MLKQSQILPTAQTALNHHKEALVSELLLLSPAILPEETLMIEGFFQSSGKKPGKYFENM